jgi:hypothetical protein
MSESEFLRGARQVASIKDARIDELERAKWRAEFESGLWHAECIMSAIAADKAEAELEALWAAHSKHHPSCEDCGEATRGDGES